MFIKTILILILGLLSQSTNINQSILEEFEVSMDIPNSTMPLNVRLVLTNKTVAAIMGVQNITSFNKTMMSIRNNIINTFSLAINDSLICLNKIQQNFENKTFFNYIPPFTCLKNTSFTIIITNLDPQQGVTLNNIKTTLVNVVYTYYTDQITFYITAIETVHYILSDIEVVISKNPILAIALGQCTARLPYLCGGLLAALGVNSLITKALPYFTTCGLLNPGPSTTCPVCCKDSTCCCTDGTNPPGYSGCCGTSLNSWYC